jgi:cobalamin biosynthesis protein CobD/CbiB
MPWPDTLLILILALTVEAVFGYPARLYAWIGHPVTWIGRLIGRLDRTLNREAWPDGQRRLAGALALLLLLLTTGLPTLAVQAFLLTLGIPASSSWRFFPAPCSPSAACTSTWRRCRRACASAGSGRARGRVDDRRAQS